MTDIIDYSPEPRPHANKGQTRRDLPPIEDVPAVAPRCPWCDRKLTPWSKDTYANVPLEGGRGFHQKVVRRVFNGWNCYDGLWDRLVCARAFATAAHKAGFRRKR